MNRTIRGTVLTAVACLLLTDGGPVPLAIRHLAGAEISSADDKVNRAKCVSTLKSIFLGLDDYHTAHGTLPAAYSVDKAGKPLLSWRIQILPFLGHKPLYDRFHLDEPWDSPHNKALLKFMPRDYACPNASAELTREGKTSYLTPRGPATAFPGSEPVSYDGITDGLPNTVLVVEASDSAAVFWTKPEDWNVEGEPKSRALSGRHSQGTNFLMASSTVTTIRNPIEPALLKGIMTRNGKEVIPDGF